MRVLVLALCAGLAATLPTSPEVYPSGHTDSAHVSEEASYFYSTEGERIIEITVEEAPAYNLVCVPSKELVSSAQVIVQETVDEEAEAAAAAAAAAAAGAAASSAAAGEGAASSAAAGLGAASSAAAGEGAASSAAAGEGAASSAAASEGAASSAAAGEGAASSAAAGEGAASSAAASEGAASSAAASEGAASSAAASEGAASSSAAGEGAASSAAAGEGAASSAAASEGAASSAAAGEGAASSAAAGAGAASSAAASEGAASSAAAGEGAASSAAAGEGAASSAAAGEGAASSAAAGEGAASSAAAGEGAASSAAAGEGAASSAAAGEGAASSAAAGEGAASSAAAGAGAASSAAAGAGAASSAAAGAGASASAAIYVESYDGPDDLDKCTCVPYYLCKDENIISDGAGEIDIRFGDGAAGPTNSKCSHYESVCCLHPEVRPLPEIVEELTAEPYYPNCGRRNPEGFGFGIAGFKDSESQFAEFPYMAIVMEQEYVGGVQRNRYVCGGSLVSERVILTAAHCVADKDTSKLVVRLGDWNTKTTTELLPHQEYHVTRKAVHERFNSRSLFNTVALLLLDRNVEFQPHVDTICLPSLADVDGRALFYDSKHCVATGFGRDQFEGGHYQNIMKQVDLSEVPRDTCQKKLRKTRLGRWFRLHSSFTCAGGKPGVDTCRGDGGSPLVCPLLSDPSRYVQVGIVAWGIGCGQGGVPGVYASTSRLAHWIHEHLAELMHYTGETHPDTHEGVQVCVTQNPYTEYQEQIPIKVGHPPPPPPPQVYPEPEYQQQQQGGY